MTKLRKKMRKKKRTLILLQENVVNAKNAQNMWRGTHFGKPIFDINYYTKRNRLYKDGVSLQTSKEMMRYFLECVGDNDPSTYSQNGLNGKTTAYLWFAWEKLLGKREELGVAYLPEEHFRWFAELEPLITNDKMWWVLMKDVWTYNSSFFTEECFNRNGRLKLPFKYRTKWMEYLDACNGLTMLKEGKHSSEFVNASYDLLDDDEPLYVYRSFKVENGKPIRKGLLKNSPYAHQQENGAGLSFTENKSVAVKIADPISAYHFEKYSDVEENDALDIMKNVLGERVINNITYGNDFYSCLGLYCIKKRDILFYTDNMGEKEIVVQPRNAELVDYRFLNLVDYCATRITEIYGSQFEDNENKSKSILANTDALYDLMHRSVKEVFTQEPNIICKILSPNMTDGLKDLTMRVQDDLPDRLWVDMCKKQNGQQIGFWVVGDKPCFLISKGVRQRTTEPTTDIKSLMDGAGVFQRVA